MRVFVYEHIVGGGMIADQLIPAGLLREGRAMHQALIEDFAATGAQVATTLDARIADQYVQTGSTSIESVVVDDPDSARSEFDRLSASADWTVVVAPEIDGALADRSARVRQVGGRLLGLSDQVISVTSDKQATVELLEARNVPCVTGLKIVEDRSPPAGLSYPAVVKPRDGAGCEGMVVVRSETDWSHVNGAVGRCRVEPLVTGTAVSVTLLCSTSGAFPLLAGRQDVRISDRVSYHGGTLPCRDDEGRRALELAEQAVAALPRPLGVGLLGIDMILDRDIRRAHDVVVEINPRVTTSYVALRRLADGNLAQSMLDLAAGTVPRLAFQNTNVEFSPDGQVRTVTEGSSTSLV